MSSFLIVDDHEVVRRGLKGLLREEYPDALIGEASDFATLREQLPEHKWDMILLDIILPGSTVVDVIAHIRKADPEARILMLTAVSEAEYAVSTIRAGAKGFITKQTASEELKDAVRTVLAGDVYLSTGARTALAASLQGASTGAPHESLSQRELEVFCMIAEGKAVKQIAYDLSVSVKTIGTYIARIKAKTGLESYVDIARYALQHKLVQ